jgi:hypothetical protein
VRRLSFRLVEFIEHVGRHQVSSADSSDVDASLIEVVAPLTEQLPVEVHQEVDLV